MLENKKIGGNFSLYRIEKHDFQYKTYPSLIPPIKYFIMGTMTISLGYKCSKVSRPSPTPLLLLVVVVVVMHQVDLAATANIARLNIFLKPPSKTA